MFFRQLECSIGDKQDVILDVDDVPIRNVIDQVSNKHGESFLDFLHEARMAVTNGRVKGDNIFTSVSVKGKSVVDYFVMPHENISNCTSFAVHLVSDIIEANNLESMLSSRCKAPDHSFISMTYEIQISNLRESNDINLSDEMVDINKRYNYGTMSQNFFKSASWIRILDAFISRLDNISGSQVELDIYYDDLLSKIFCEMDSHIDYKSA